MQLSSQINSYAWPQPLRAERLVPASGAQLIFALALIVLAFVPLVPMADALEGGLTARGIIEFGLLLVGLGLLAIFLKSQGAFSFDLKSPAFLLISLFTFWGVISSIWSFNPLLSIAKSAELWCVSLAGLMFVTLAWRSRLESGKLETLLGLSMALVVGGLLVANIFYWGKPLPTTGDTSLPLELIGHEVISDRPRLILAYQHELLTADLLALAVICLLTSNLNKVLKATLIPCLLALLWMTDARGPTAGLLVAMAALAVLKLRRNDVRAIVLMLAMSIAVAGLFVFHDRLPAAVSSLMTDDVSTLNSRTELWAGSVKHVLARPILGTGYFASRYLLIKEFPWAGHAHNSFLEVLITTGLVGLLILFAFVFHVIKQSIKTRSPLLLGVTLYCLIQGMMNPLIFNPGLAMFVLTIAVLAAGSEDQDAQVVRSHFKRGFGGFTS